MTSQTETNLRSFMRSCQQFWQRQYVNKPQRDGTLVPTQVTYEQSLIGVYCDIKGTVIDKPNVFFASPGDIITEADACRVFNTEFSSSWEDAQKHYCPGGPLPYPIIPNFHPSFKEL